MVVAAAPSLRVAIDRLKPLVRPLTRGISRRPIAPIYRAREVWDGHEGKVAVAIVFGTDGMPRKATIESSSGDGLLERRVIETAMHDVLLTKDGSPLPEEVTFRHGYTFNSR